MFLVHGVASVFFSLILTVGDVELEVVFSSEKNKT